MILYTAALATLAALCLARPEVQIGPTKFVGRDVAGLKQDFFGGIPFAEAPAGALRLRVPVLKTRLNVSTFDASNFGHSCLQPPTSDYPFETLDEDCLFINVFRPSNLPRNASLPVLFWVYGGGFYAGSSSLPLYNASAIIAQSVSRGTPIIYVSFNYRLGPLGVPQGSEAQRLGQLNLALKDELAALEWVHENIGFFGGNKDKVTIFGESAGAVMNAILYLNSPLAKYARGAIFESGSAATPIIDRAEDRESRWQDFVGSVSSCASLAQSGSTFDCLRKANSTDIFRGLLDSLAKAPEAFPFVPTIDGPGGLYPDYPSRLLSSGHFARLPFIAGTNLDEGTALIPTYITSEEQLRSWIIANFSSPFVNPSALNSSIDEILELYPNNPALGSPYGTGNETFGRPPVFKQAAAIQGDVWFLSQRRAFQQAASKFGVETYGYLFTEETPSYIQRGLGVVHSSEVPFVYGAPPNTPTAEIISALTIDYWISFTYSLDPNEGKGLARVHWAPYASKEPNVLQLNGANLTMIPDNFRKHQVDYLNSIPQVLHHRSL